MASGRTGIKIDELPNPRNEAEENDLHVKNDRFLSLHLLGPSTLGAALMEEVTGIARKHAHRCGCSKIPCVSLWQGGQAAQAPVPAHRKASRA